MIQFKSQQITVFQSALFCTLSTVIQTPDLILVVDPNWLPNEVEAIQDFVNKERKGRPVFLLFTHSDYDHIIAWKAFPDAKVIASKAFAENQKKEEILEEIRTFDDEYYITRNYEIAYPVVDYVIGEEGQQLKFGVTTLTFYQAKGHNSDGIFAIVNNDIWIAGDYFCEVEFPYIYHSSYEYERTLAKTEAILAKHQPKILVPGHGTVATTHQEILKRKATAIAYLQELRDCIKTGKPFDVQQLLSRYKFRRVMETFHAANEVLIRKEMATSGDVS